MGQFYADLFLYFTIGYSDYEYVSSCLIAGVWDVSSPHLLIENGHPVCTLCRRALQGLGQDPDPKRLYLLQLLEWTFATGEVKDRGGEVLGTVRDMKMWKPRNVLEFVAGSNGTRSMALPREDLTPRELAYYLLLLLQASVAEQQSAAFHIRK